MSTTKAPAKRKRLSERLAGKTGFAVGPYKTPHCAHASATNARRLIEREGLTGWKVTVDAEKMVVRFSRAAD